jgi:hypothetical protein
MSQRGLTISTSGSVSLAHSVAHCASVVAGAWKGVAGAHAASSKQPSQLAALAAASQDEARATQSSGSARHRAI